MGVVGWLVVGFVAGALARAATGRGRGVGCLGTILIGILGGLIGGFAFQLVTDEGIGSFGLRSMLVAFVGAATLLLIFGRRFDGPR